jgi:probable rRNA maturation factor
MVEVDNRTAEPLDAATLAAVVDHVLEACGAPDAEVGVLLVDAGEMRDLNRLHRQRDEVTDVLAFPIDEDDDVPPGLPRMLGDVVVCPEQAERQADEAGVSREREVTTLVVHGTLHLLGFDHEHDEGEMLARQDALLREAPGVRWPA